MRVDVRDAYHSDQAKIRAKAKRKQRDIEIKHKRKINPLYKKMLKLRQQWEAPERIEQSQRRDIMRFPCREVIKYKDPINGWTTKHRNEECPLCWPHGHSKYDDPGCNCPMGTKPEKCDKDEWHKAEAVLEDQINRIMNTMAKDEEQTLKNLERETQVRIENPLKESKFYDVILGIDPESKNKEMEYYRIERQMERNKTQKRIEMERKSKEIAAKFRGNT